MVFIPCTHCNYSTPRWQLQWKCRELRIQVAGWIRQGTTAINQGQRADDAARRPASQSNGIQSRRSSAAQHQIHTLPQLSTEVATTVCGPFEIIRKMSRAAYELKLPDAWSIHPVFHISLLKPWRESSWSSPVDLQPEDTEDIEPEARPLYEVEKILRWRRVQIGERRLGSFWSLLADTLWRKQCGYQNKTFHFPRNWNECWSRINQ